MNKYALAAIIVFVASYIVNLLLTFFPGGSLFFFNLFHSPIGLFIYAGNWGSPVLMLAVIFLCIQALRNIDKTRETGKTISWIILVLSAVQLVALIMFAWVVLQL